MNDLDFDELDKAVNSLMTNVPQQPSTQPKNDEAEHTLTITPTLKDDTTPDRLNEAINRAATVATPVAAQKEDVVEDVMTSVPAAPAAQMPAIRRGGRFMDVVHPSSDMKKPTIPERPVGRTGATIEPMRSSITSARPEPTSPVSPVAPSAPEIPKPVHEWPDPLEMTGSKETEVPAEEEWSLPTTPKDDSPSDAPLVSPFLPDTKVEKRPLGSATLSMVEEPASTSAADEVKKTVDDPNDQLPAMPQEVDPPLPEELRSDMMAVEADTHMGVPKTEESHPLEKPTEAKPESKADTPLLSAGPASIPQQYHEEPSTGDKESGGIYDTSSYHQPLAHPAKKKSGWMWIVWIVLILLVGAGIGAALFFFDLI